MAKDPSSLVRRKFVDKTYKLLKEHTIPYRYACAFALAASVSKKDLQEDSLKYMTEFIKDYSIEAHLVPNTANQGGMTDDPVYIVVFLIHVLALDRGFPEGEYTDLASLKFLSIESGGSLFLYSNTDDSTLPQDMYRMSSRQYAFSCILQLRTSTEFKSGHSYGHFFPYPKYENVQHIISCDSYATYSYYFEFANEVGFFRHTSELPMVQIAFQHTVVVPLEELSNYGSSVARRSQHFLQRRLRIRTVQFGTAHNINENYDSVDPEVVLPILVHKVILASLEQSIREGRMLLHDWLPLPRLVFALLRNPVLRFPEEGVHPDYRIYLQCLFSALEPSSLSRAIYPLLSSYATPDIQAYPRHSLSRAALITSESPIFFLDAFTTLVVFYSSTADPTLPYPPPHDCLLRTAINKLKQERSITPKLIFIRGGQDDATVFENLLIEEQDVDGSGFTSVMGLLSFLDEMKHSVLEYMK